MMIVPDAVRYFNKRRKQMSKLPVLLATLIVASMTAPALAAGGPNCYHLRCDTAPLQIQAPTVPHPSGHERG
jgi:hypothetical protein